MDPMKQKLKRLEQLVETLMDNNDQLSRSQLKLSDENKRVREENCNLAKENSQLKLENEKLKNVVQVSCTHNQDNQVETKSATEVNTVSQLLKRSILVRKDLFPKSVNQRKVGNLNKPEEKSAMNMVSKYLNRSLFTIK